MNTRLTYLGALESTRDNTAANADGPSNRSGSGEQKEGFMDKVKDKLNIGSDSK